MKIILIGPGGTSIPPKGWGAVESIVWDYYEELLKLGHEVNIINENTHAEIIKKTNEYYADVIYIMYDDHIVVAPHIQCKQIFYMSHYAYIIQPGFETKQSYYFNQIFKKVIEYQDYITLNAISDEILEVYKKYGYTGKANVICNGARKDLFKYKENPIYPDKSIYVAKIEVRKSQYKYQSIKDICFVGNYHNSSFDIRQPNYLGEWTKPVLYESLTEYGNLVLLSNGEADPLVIKEALLSGLGVVVSECASANLDRNSPFICIIPDNRLDDIQYVTEKIKDNREISISMRSHIREYALNKFTWSRIVSEFMDSIGNNNKNSGMRIALIGPGIMPIPPKGWGAVEILIWDYYQELTRQGHMVTIINTPDRKQIIELVNNGKYDFVHLHYDVFWDILDKLQCPKIAITTHYPYIDQPEKHMSDGYSRIFHFLVNQKKYMNFVLAEKDYNAFLNAGADPKSMYKMKNGINSSIFRFSESCLFSNKTIYLGKITARKNQAKYQSIGGIDFIGGCHDTSFHTENPNYLGEWTREHLHEHLTDYANMVLLSEGEADPLVVKEALISGLGIVVNRSSAENLDISRDFITVIDDNKMEDLDYISKRILENRIVSITKRAEIREYGISMFDIRKEVEKYISIMA